MEIPESIIKAPRIDCFTNSAKAVYIASVLKVTEASYLHIVVARDKKNAYFATSDLYNFFTSDSVYYLPDSTASSQLKEVSAKVQRISAISAITAFPEGGAGLRTGYDAQNADSGKTGLDAEKDIAAAFAKGSYDLRNIKPTKTGHLIVVTYPGALEEGVMKGSEAASAILSIAVGDEKSHSQVREKLAENGFRKVDFVSEPGEFAVRGSIIDIFSFADNNPYRIDFFGDEVDSIRRFNADTQFSIESCDRVDIYPDLTGEGKSGEFCPIWDILPENTILWDIRDEDLSVPAAARVIPQPSFNKNFEILAADIEEKIIAGYSVNVLSPNDSQTERLRGILSETGAGYMPGFLPLSIHEGYIDKGAKVCFYTDHQIFERYHKVRIRRQVERSGRLTINELNAMQVGDYVVHIDHGVGRYGGLVKTNINGQIQEAVKLEYKDNDVIFVSIHGIHRIAKYRSRDGEPPKIYKLGSKAWESLKNTTKSKIKDIAKDLINLYARRRQLKGFAFSPDTYLQHELESSFIYEDTPDQQKATEAVKRDMESPHPMDRLICGDVGFGKTEIAIRAAFKAVCDSKQVAVLVPTTILAMQHYRTFSERLKNFPCTVEYVSRLRTAAQIKDIRQRLKEGKIDIIIGTHRLLGKGFEIPKLELLIIDEEQKFGVTAKEKLRQMKADVNTLTLTATPIPRTLQFSLLGARDLSIINTPPPNRQPVYTEVIHFDDDTIAEIIGREIERGGQVFFVHNRVEDILSVQTILHRILPQASICVAHGQMEPAELEKRVIDFISGNYDILLSTTIMENGVDIPNANTIIINHAHRFGLSDLHQLRGRVGRSNIKAYCYLVIPSADSITDDARRRIRAVEAFSDLGSGFNISMQDLDIRGAGNLLGAEQSGFVAEMGFETYMRILSEAMAELPAEIRPRDVITTDTQVETDLEAMIPDDYINVPYEKLRLYRELGNLADEEQTARFVAGITDRFGPLPKPFEALLDIVRLRQTARRLGIERIVLKNSMMLAYFISNQMDPFYLENRFQGVVESVLRQGRRFTFVQRPEKLYIKAERVTSTAMAVTLLRTLLPAESA